MKFSTSLNKNYEFRRLYSRGSSASGYLLVLYCRKNRTGSNKFGITVSNKLGKAVVRNRVRRRLREIYRLNEEKFFTGWDIVVVARARSVESDYHRLEQEFLYLADKLGLLRTADSE